MVYLGEIGPSCSHCGRSPHGDRPCQTVSGEESKFGRAKGSVGMKRAYMAIGAAASAPLWVLFGAWISSLGAVEANVAVALLMVAVVIYVAADLVALLTPVGRHRDGVKVCDLVEEIRRMPS